MGVESVVHLPCCSYGVEGRVWLWGLMRATGRNRRTHWMDSNPFGPDLYVDRQSIADRAARWLFQSSVQKPASDATICREKHQASSRFTRRIGAQHQP